MSVLNNIINQQFGFFKWNCYDQNLLRLNCNLEEDYFEDHRQIASPIFASKFSNQASYEHLLAMSNEDGKLILHDSDQKKDYFRTQVHLNAIFDVAWLDKMRLVTVSGDHTAKVVDFGKNILQTVQIFVGHTRSLKTVTVRPLDRNIFATGSRDGSIRIWDIRATVNGPFTAYQSDRSIFNSHCLFKPNKRPNCSSPSSSASFLSKTKRKRSMLNIIEKGSSQGSVQEISTGNNGTSKCTAVSVTGLVFQDEDTLISCGSGDGSIKVWDLRKTYTTWKSNPCPKYLIPYTGKTTLNGFSNLTIDASRNRLYANCLDNNIYCYNIGTYNKNPIGIFNGHKNESFYIKSVLDKEGKYLLSGSSDHNAYIWNVQASQKYEQCKPYVRLKGHTAEVTCVAWKLPKYGHKMNHMTLVTCSDDLHFKIWRDDHVLNTQDEEVLQHAKHNLVELVKKNHTETLSDDNSLETLKPSKIRRLNIKYDTRKYNFIECGGSVRVEEESSNENKSKGNNIKMFLVEEEQENIPFSDENLSLNVSCEQKTDVFHKQCTCRSNEQIKNIFTSRLGSDQNNLLNNIEQYQAAQLTNIVTRKTDDTLFLQNRKEDFEPHEITPHKESQPTGLELAYFMPESMISKPKNNSSESSIVSSISQELKNYSLPNSSKSNPTESSIDLQDSENDLLTNSKEKHSYLPTDCICTNTNSIENNSQELNHILLTSPKSKCPICNSIKINCICSLDKSTPKSSNLRQQIMTPNQPSISDEYFSPTSNLPNYAIDGSAPHLHFSPQKKQDRDWLTKIRMEKERSACSNGDKDDINEQKRIITPQSGSRRSNLQSLSKSTPKRRPNCGSPDTRSTQSPLLRYFRTANNSIMKDSTDSDKVPFKTTLIK